MKPASAQIHLANQDSENVLLVLLSNAKVASRRMSVIDSLGLATLVACRNACQPFILQSHLSLRHTHNNAPLASDTEVVHPEVSKKDARRSKSGCGQVKSIL